MGATYTRQSSYTDGDTITAAHTNDEFNQLLAAFAASTGHTHDGTTAEGGPITKLLGNTLTFGAATAGTDITITFDGESNDGVLKWMEDEDYFEFSDDILIASTEKLQFRDTAIYINSSTDGQLDLVADSEIQIAATTIDMNGNVDISGTLTIGSAGISEAELEILDGATVTTTEINIMDGDTSASSTTVADADRVVFNDAGTMKQVAVTDLAAYFDDEITAMPNLVTTAATTVGALDSGSITSGFGTIDTGSSTITTTGLISGGSLDIDDVLINGTTIGHTDDTDLMTVASGLLTVAGEVSMTTLDIGGTNVTSTAAELNYSDTGAAVGTVVASKVVTADANKDVASFRNITLTGELDAGSLDVSGDADIDGTLEADAITVNGTALNTVIAGVTVTDATNSAHVLVTDNESTNEENLITFVEGATSSTGNVGLEMDGNLAYNPSTGTVTATIFKGNIDAVDGDFDGTLEADAITLDGTAITTVATLSTGISNGNLPVFTSGAADNDFLRIDGTSIEGRSASEVLSDIAAAPAAGSSNIVTTGALNSGSITSGFGAIDNGSSAITTTGVGSFGSLDISGDIDIDGTANLDVVDIDGAVDMASTLTLAGNADFNGNLDVDGTTDLDTTNVVGAFTVTGDVTLNDGSPNLRLNDSDVSRFVDILYGTRVATFRNTMASGEDMDSVEPSMVFSFKDDGETRTAMTIDHDAATTIHSSGGATPTYSHTNNGEGLTFRYNDDSGARAADIIATGNTPAGATMAMRFFTSPNSTDNAAEVMRLQDGKVGIGTTSPSRLLTLDNSTNDGVAAQFQNEEVALQMAIDGGGTDTYTNSAHSVTMTTTRVDSGDLPKLRLAGQGGLELAVDANNVRLNIDTNGLVKIGTTATALESAGNEGVIFHPAGKSIISQDSSVCIELHRSDDDTADDTVVLLRRRGSICGSISCTPSATSFNTSSDYRLKTSVTYDWDATTRLKQLKPARFEWIADGDDSVPVDGFLAHEVSSIIPEAINGTKDAVEVWTEPVLDADGNIISGEKLPDGVSVGDNKLDDDGNTIPVYQGIDQSKIVPLLVKTIQELEARITALEAG